LLGVAVRGHGGDTSSATPPAVTIAPSSSLASDPQAIDQPTEAATDAMRSLDVRRHLMAGAMPPGTQYEY
jgi:hypothetical protein